MVLPFQIIQFDIIQLIGIIELLISVGLSFIIAIITLQKYRTTEMKSMLTFSINFFFLGGALLCMVTHRIILYTFNEV